jgi:hypothetical protein
VEDKAISDRAVHNPFAGLRNGDAFRVPHALPIPLAADVGCEAALTSQAVSRGEKVTSLTFGGADLKDLYIVTGSAINLAVYDRTGAVFKTRVDTPGLATPSTRF